MPWKMDWDHWWLVWIARFLWGYTGFGLNLHPNLACQVRLKSPSLLIWNGLQGPQVRRAPHFRFRESSNNMLRAHVSYLAFCIILQHIASYIYNHIFVCGKRIWHSYYNDSIITRIVQCTVVRILTKAMFLISIIPLILAVLLILGSAAVALSKGWEARHHNPRLHSFLLDIRNVSIVVSLFWLLESLQSTTLRPSKSVGQSCPPAIAETVATLEWNFTPEWPIDSPSSRDRHWLDFREPRLFSLAMSGCPKFLPRHQSLCACVLEKSWCRPWICLARLSLVLHWKIRWMLEMVETVLD